MRQFTFLMLVLAVVLTGASAANSQNLPRHHNAPPHRSLAAAGTIDLPASAAWGHPTAPHSILIYSSLGCRYCAEFHLTILPKLRRLFAETQQARIELRDFPLDERSAKAAVLARCTGRSEDYVAIADTLFARRSEWADLPTADALAAASAIIAERTAIPAATLQAHVADEQKLNDVLASGLQGMKDFHLDSTPSLVVDGHVYDGPTEEDAILEFVTEKVSATAPFTRSEGVRGAG